MNGWFASYRGFPLILNWLRLSVSGSLIGDLSLLHSIDWF